jgi:predicted kinase
MDIQNTIRKFNDYSSKITVVIPVGVLGSGKSTLAKKKIAENPNMMAVSKDSLREMFYTKYAYRPKDEATVKHCENLLIYSLVTNRNDVFVDDTNLTIGTRRLIIDTAKGAASECSVPIDIVCHYFIPSPDYLQRRKKENRGLSEEQWENAYQEQIDILDVPKMEEGFSVIITHGITSPIAPKEEVEDFVNYYEKCPVCKVDIKAFVNACPQCNKSFCE